jgi:hypothetical protein
MIRSSVFVGIDVSMSVVVRRSKRTELARANTEHQLISAESTLFSRCNSLLLFESHPWDAETKDDIDQSNDFGVFQNRVLKSQAPCPSLAWQTAHRTENGFQNDPMDVVKKIDRLI